MATDNPYTVLSDVHLSFHPTIMQVHTNMLGVCQTSYPETWTIERTVVSNTKNTKVSSMGRKRLRPGTVSRPKLKILEILETLEKLERLEITKRTYDKELC